jgi:hypothetical protein
MRKGIATPITLVVLMVVFTSLLAATGYMALGTLRGGASERVTYQAFTLAESALEAFPLLVRCGENQSLPSAYTLSVSGGPALSATYSYPNRESTVPSGGGNIRVQAVAEVGGGKATLEQTFRVGCGILGAVPAALTSRPRVEVSGNAKIVGFDFAADSGFLRVATVRLNGSLNLLSALDQNTGTFNLDVDDATLIPTGSYLRITTGGTPKTYRVEGKSGNTLTLTPLFTPDLNDDILPGAPVELAPYGVKAYDPSTNTLTLSDARGLVKGQKVRVGSFEGVVESVENVQVKVSWSGTPPTSIPEGTPLVAQVLGAASSRTIDTSGGGQILYGSAPSSPMVPTSPDDLFQRVFGMSKEEFRRLYPPVSASSFGGTLQNWEIKSVSGPLNLAGNSELCGKGILVVFGELTVNGTCPQGFQGLVYVAGDYDQQGNADLRGAVVVEGVANLEGCGPQGGGDDCWTNIAGTQGRQAGGKIEYDPLVLYRLRVMSQGLTSVSPVSGTWRRP